MSARGSSGLVISSRVSGGFARGEDWGFSREAVEEAMLGRRLSGVFVRDGELEPGDGWRNESSARRRLARREFRKAVKLLAMISQSCDHMDEANVLQRLSRVLCRTCRCLEAGYPISNC